MGILINKYRLFAIEWERIRYFSSKSKILGNLHQRNRALSEKKWLFFGNADKKHKTQGESHVHPLQKKAAYVSI